MVEIKTVAVVGGSGNLGIPIINQLLKDGFAVTALKRPDSKSTFPSAVKVVTADYSSVDSVAAVFKGIDAVVSVVGQGPAAACQNVLVDAAVAAGVKRFLPSDYGCPLANPNVAALPVFKSKLAIHKQLQEATSKGLTYTLVCNGPFLDWGVQNRFVLDLSEANPRIYDGGDNVFSTTTLAGIAQGVSGTLKHYEETKNRFVYIKSTDQSQNGLLAIAKKLAPEKKWSQTDVSTVEVEKASNASLAKGEINQMVMYGYLFRAIFGKGDFGAKWSKEQDDSELLGVTQISEDDIAAFIKPLL
ncbi:Pinoresinol reductase [Lachnellula suecica]|uniref:Pinoresinol reductase n=1 Tax=Lachnellula suecica TaxID=602035 RepID=A0A8T9C867_9HELO|nr:Pinoresinol reductase [Lachnellula suecica]